MSDLSTPSTIELIQKTEREAEDLIARARYKAAAREKDVVEKYSGRLSTLKETLSAEMAEIATTVQQEGQSFKEGVTSEITRELAAIKKNSQQHVSRAAGHVVEAFHKHVSQ
jgi:vacuolar-type H+-ATPase subunit H